MAFPTIPAVVVASEATAADTLLDEESHKPIMNEFVPKKPQSTDIAPKCKDSISVLNAL